MCLPFGRENKKNRRNDGIVRRSTTFRIPRFGQHQNPVRGIRQLIDMTTMVAPTQDGFLKRIMTTTEKPSAADMEENMLVLTPAIQKHLRRVYDVACGRSLTLPREKFATFLRETQGEEAIVPLELESYRYEQFLQVWYLQYGWKALRPLREDEKDMTKPISNYFISSSHNTYLVGNQLSSRSSAAAYRTVLERNCRCVEIDVWNGDASGSRTPRSKSPGRLRPGGDHARHISVSSLPSPAAAARALEAVEDGIESVKQIIHDTFHHRRNHSHQSHHSHHSHDTRARGHAHSHSATSAVYSNRTACGSALSLDTCDLADRLERSRHATKPDWNEPIVMHGWTLTSPVGFREVCKTIRETAFETNPLPIIVSLEVHADLDQQQVMVDIMKEEWDGVLLDQPSGECDPDQRQPRLEELLRKILIKVKRPLVKVATGSTGTSTLTPASTSTLYEDDFSGSEDERVAPAKRNKAAVPIHESLAALAIYTHSAHFKSFNSAAARALGHIFSINENRILELHATRPKDVFRHNRHHFMRAFPKGMRVDSSNPDPSQYWRKGVQMVAMNWQNKDEGMMLNTAMFADSTGWVLKPPGYRSDDADQLDDEPPVPPHRKMDLRIVLLSGQHIPLPEGWRGVPGGEQHFRPFVKVELHVEKCHTEKKADHASQGTGLGIYVNGSNNNDSGSKERVDQQQQGATADGAMVPSDEKGMKETSVKEIPVKDDKLETRHSQQYRQKTTARQTDHPDFGKYGVAIEFLKIPWVVEELSFVRFKVEDDASYLTDKHAAWACVRLDRLRQGYRFIELKDPKGNSTIGKLLVRIEKTYRD